MPHDHRCHRCPAHPGAADPAGQLVDLPGVFVRLEDGTTGMGFSYAFTRAGRSITLLIDEVLAPATIGRDFEASTQVAPKAEVRS